MQSFDQQLHRTVVTSVLLTLGVIVYETLALTNGATAERVQLSATWQLALVLVGILCFIVNCCCSIAYLTQHKTQADALAVVSAQAGVVCCSLLLIISAVTTRYLFAAWWRREDAQTPVYLHLWLIYVGYLLLRRYTSLGQTSRLASVFGVLAFFSLLMTYFAASIGRQLWLLVQGTWTDSSESLVRHFVMFITLAGLVVWAQYRIATRKQESDEFGGSNWGT